MITAEKVQKFLNSNFEGNDNVDFDLVNDILTVSELYDRNYERIHAALKREKTVKWHQYLRIEKKLNDLCELMRDVAGIRSRDPGLDGFETQKDQVGVRVQAKFDKIGLGINSEC